MGDAADRILDGEIDQETGEWIDDDWDFDDGEEVTCDRCWGEGVIVVCCDDMCVGRGECFHGDGMAMCPDCEGRGYWIDEE